MKRHLYALVAAPLLALAACGGGGGGSGTSLSVSPAQLQFTMDDGGAAPGPQTVTASFKGDGLLVGYAPGVEPPSWLSVQQMTGGTTSPQTFRFHVTQPGVPGPYSTSVRFVTGRVDGSGIKYRDMPVTVVVNPVFGVSPETLTRSFVRGGSHFAQDTFSVLKEDSNWGVSVDQPWVATSITYGPEPWGTGYVTLYYDVAALAPGQHTATATVYDTMGLEESRTVSVTLNVRGPNLVAEAAAKQFSALSAGTGPDAQTVNIGSETSEAVPHTVGVTYGAGAAGWLNPIDDGTTPRTLSLAPTTTQLSPGTYTAAITLTPANGQPPVTINVSYTLAAATLVTTGSLGPFNVDQETTAGAALHDSVLFSDDGAPLSWRVTEVSAPWLQVTASGDTRENQTLALDVVAEELDAMANGTYQAEIVLEYGNDVTPVRSAGFVVTLNLVLPEVTAVAPYYAEQNRSLPHIIRGSGFTALTRPLYVGNTEIADYEVVSDTEIRATMPAMAMGDHVVRFDNALGLQHSRARLRVVSTPAFGAFTLARPHFSSRLIYDPVRQTVYSVDGRYTPDVEQVTRYAWNGSAWEESALLQMPGLVDIELGNDGDTLYLSAAHVLYTLDLADPAASPTALLTLMDYEDVGTLDMLNDGRIVLANHTGYGVTIYDPATNSVARRDKSMTCAWSAASAMRQAVVVLGCGEAIRFDTTSNAFLQASVDMQGGNGRAAMNRTGDRAVAYMKILDASLNVLGTLGEREMYGTAFNAAGTRLYGMYKNYEQQKTYFAVFDMSQAPVAGAFVNLAEVEVPDATELTPIGSRSVITPDDKTMIFAGIEEFRVYPIPAE